MNLTVTMAVTLCALLGAASVVSAGELALPDTDVRPVRSRANGVDYKLYISVPPKYAGSEKRYPVIYLLDADYSFPIARAIVQHLSDRNRLRQIIVVGIAYGGPDRYRMNRTRDYTPTHTLEGGYGPEYQRVSGGAPKFLRFLREELIPWIDGRYRTVPGERALVGHSYGGLFASWVLLTRPDAFSRYIIVSPSLWYDDSMMFALEKETRASAASRAAKVYLSVGSREHGDRGSMITDLGKFVEAIRGRHVPAGSMKHEVFDDETHDSVFPTALSRGIRFTFDGH